MTQTPTVIDLYHEDDVTSWSELASAGITTVIHKATQGVTEVDPLYAKRQPEAMAAGLVWDAYLFWANDDPQAMADAFLKALGAGRSPSAYWLDYEESGGTPTNIMAVMQSVSDGTGEPMGLYTTLSLAEALAEKATDAQAEFFSEAPLWLAEPGVEKPVLRPRSALIWPTISLWQYTWNGKIAGVKGKVDLNCVPEGSAVA